MAGRFRVDKDEAGNAEVSCAKPRKLRPLEDEEVSSPSRGSTMEASAQPSATGQPTPVAKTALKSGLKKSAIKSSSMEPLPPEPPRQPQEPSPPQTPMQQPRSAMKSSMKTGSMAMASSGGSQPAPAAPPARPTPALKSGLKSGLKTGGQQFTPAPPSEPPPSSVKSALKSRPLAPAPEPAKPAGALAGGSSSSAARPTPGPPAMPARGRVGRPSVFKMDILIQDPTAWTTQALCKHYYHYVSQKFLWEEQIQSTERSRKSIKVGALSLDNELNDIATNSEADPSAPPGDLVRPGSRNSRPNSRSGRKSLIHSPNIILEEEQKEAPKVGDLHYSISPLKELLLMKKPDLKKLGTLLQDKAIRDKWLNSSLDNTPPPMPAPLFHAAACACWDVVNLLVKEKVDVNAQYQGKSMLKGWIKPNTPLVECVRGRKGRFIGTMLGDKLDAMETMLTNAMRQQDSPSTVEESKAEPVVVPSPKVNPRNQRKSVQLQSSRGLMLHTQGHPNLKYELDTHFKYASSSSVRPAINTETQEPFAVKAGCKSKETSMKDPEFELWNEIVILRKLQHPNVIKLFETFEDESHIFMVFELCQGGELFDRLVHEGSFKEDTVMRVAYQMGAAIRHLHGLRICHRDIRPEAFIVADSRSLDETYIKMIDFSTAKELGPQPLTTKICTLHYVAPEVLTSSNGYNEKVDVWSFGVVVYMMAAGVPPFDADNELDVLKAVKSGEFEFEPEHIWSSFSQAPKQVIESALIYDPGARPEIASIMDHPRLVSAEAEVAMFTSSNTNSRNVIPDSTQKTIRNAFCLLGENIDDDHIAQLRMMFRGLDEPGTGMVDFVDCRCSVLRMLQESLAADRLPANEDIGNVIKMLSSDNLCGKVNYAMFLATMTDKRRRLRKEAARAVFNTFDIDKNWQVSIYEISQALKKEHKFLVAKTNPVQAKEMQDVWLEMRDVFGTNPEALGPMELELSFEDFFKLLPKTNQELV